MISQDRFQAFPADSLFLLSLREGLMTKSEARLRTLIGTPREREGERGVPQKSSQKINKHTN